MFALKPYNGELLYSFLQRLSKYNSIIARKDIKENLFNNSAYALNVHLQNNLENISIAFNNNKVMAVSPSELLEKYTLFKYVKAFIPLSEQLNIREEFYNSKTSSSQKLRLFAYGSFHSDKMSLKVCKKCAEEDLRNYGEIYLRKLHNIPGNFMCIRHNLFLNRISIAHIERRYFFNIQSTDVDKLEEKIVPNNIAVNQIKIINMLDGLSNVKDIDLVKVERKIYSRLVRLGIKTNNIDFEQIKSRVLALVSNEHLELLELDRSLDKLSKYFIRCFKNPNCVQLSILLIVLFDDLNDLLEERESISTFYDQISCINTNCTSVRYKSPIKCRILQKYDNYLSLEVLCKNCDMIYEQTWYDFPNDTHLGRKIIRYAYSCKKLFLSLKESGNSTQVICKKMKLSKKEVILLDQIIQQEIKKKCEKNREGWSIKARSNFHSQTTRVLDTRIEELRKFINENPTLSRMEIRSMKRKDLDYIRKHSPDMLGEILPEKRHRNKK